METMFYVGTFNPLHSGHIRAASYFWDKYNFWFIQSLHSYGKGEIEYNEDQFSEFGLLSGWTKTKSYYAHYRELQGKFSVQGTTINFLVGLDTYLKIISTQYYLNSPELMKKSLDQIRATFHVFPRVGYEYVESDLIKNVYYPDFSPINISSTQLRAEADRACLG